MLRWLRKYNKWILVVGTSFLMVAFLLPLGQTGGQRQVVSTIGRVYGQEITTEDRQRAQLQRDILGALSGVFILAEGSDEDLRWLLMSLEAERMGLSASAFEVNGLLATLGLVDAATNDDSELQRRAARLNVSTDAVRDAVRQWIILQRYQSLVLGRTPAEGDMVSNAVDRFEQFRRLLMQAQFDPSALNMLDRPFGLPRLSDELIEHYVYEMGSQVDVAFVPIGYELKFGEAGPPDEATVEDLFQRYRDDFPGQSEPYGFGYRLPDRVRVEYLAFPAEDIRASIDYGEVDLLAYYRENRGRYLRPVDDPDMPREQAPYDEVRARVENDYLTDQVAERGEAMARAARAILLDQVRREFDVEGGLYQIPEDWQPMPLQDVALQIQEEFGLLPEVQRYDDRWLAEEDLEELPGVRDALVPEARLPFSEYVMGVRELLPEDVSIDDPRVGRRLQVHVPLPPMIDFSRSYYVARVIDVSPEHSPDSIDDVPNNQVRRDALRLASYQLLLDEIDQWEAALQSAGSLEEIASRAESSVIDAQPFPRRLLPTLEEPPVVQGVGQSEAFVDGVFEFAERLEFEIGFDNPMLDRQRRTIVPVEDELSLYAVEVQGFTATPVAAYREIATSPELALIIGRHGPIDPDDNPLLLDAIIERTGFTYDDEEDEASEDEGPEDEPAEPNAEPAAEPVDLDAASDEAPTQETPGG